ncbi:MAG: IS1595 family transposase [Planctomycetes bacterium]|nr:IS1595 family transposase [Planctomycetota bacterium]
METNLTSPTTLLQAIRTFADQDVAIEFVAKLRWPNGVECPTCGRKDVRYLENQRRWQCKSVHAKRQFSVKVGTIFEDSPLGLDKWLPAVWLITNAKNGISSYEIHRALGVTQKTAWFMLHRIRLAMKTGSFEKKMGGGGKIVEADETFVGGKARNMHKAVRDRRIGTGTGAFGKTVVAGLLERNTADGHSTVRTAVIPAVRQDTLHPLVRGNVETGSELHTDALHAYKALGGDFIHRFVDHAECYVKDNVHTNGLENFWSLLKRSINGTYVAVEPFHLLKYVDEQAFRFNNRKTTDGNRFVKVMGDVAGRRMTYKALIGASEVPPSGLGN